MTSTAHTPPQVAGSGWRGRLLGPNGPSLWQLLTGLIAVALASQRLAASLFYSRFDVAPEEVGVGVTASALEGVVLYVVLIVLLNVIILLPSIWALTREWLGVRTFFSWLRESAAEHRWTTAAYIVHRLTVVTAVVVFIVLLSVFPDDATIISVGFVLTIWALMATNEPFGELLAARSLPPPEKEQVRRRVLHLTGWVAIALTVVFLAAPSFYAVRDAGYVTEGRAVSGFPSTSWRVSPVRIAWLGAPSEDVDRGRQHCLMYLGQAGGVTVLFDVDEAATIRLPSADLVVRSLDSERC